MLLWEAALRGNHTAVPTLVFRGGELDARDGRRGGWTALHFAATGADQLFVGCDDLVQARTVRKLVELGADVNCSTQTGWTPLHAAATRGHMCTAIRLGALGAYLEARDCKGRTPLHMASRWGWSQTVEALLSLGANASSRDAEGLTPREHAWYYKGKIGGGDFDATIAVLMDASTSTSGVSRATDAAAAAVDDDITQVGHEGFTEFEVEEGPRRRDLDEKAIEASEDKEEVNSEDKPGVGSNSHSVLCDFDRAVGGKAAGEEVSPYDIPHTTEMIPWWDTRAWQDRAQRFQTSRASARVPAAHQSIMHNASKGRSNEATGGALVGGAGVLAIDTGRDEWGNVLLSKCRTSFPTSRRTKRSRVSEEDQHAADGSAGGRVIGVAHGTNHTASLLNSTADPSGGLEGLVDTLAAVERLDLVAKRRLVKFQERMTPRGFKGGTILQDHIDFGGGKGADKEGYRR